MHAACLVAEFGSNRLTQDVDEAVGRVGRLCYGDTSRRTRRFGILGMIVLVLDVIAIVSLLMGRSSVGHRLLWILLVLFNSRQLATVAQEVEDTIVKIMDEAVA